MLRILTILVVVCVAAEAATTNELWKIFEDSLTSLAQIAKDEKRRANDLINSKKELARDKKGSKGESCVLLEGSKYLKQIQEWYSVSIGAFDDKIRLFQRNLNNQYKVNEIEEYSNTNFFFEYETVAKEFEKKCKRLAEEFVPKADACRGEK